MDLKNFLANLKDFIEKTAKRGRITRNPQLVTRNPELGTRNPNYFC